MLARSGRPYMQCNSNFFNKALPPYAVQLVLIDLYKYPRNKSVVLSKRDHDLMKEILETLDLSKVQAVLQ